MTSVAHPFKCIVAAFGLAVGFSLPLAAETLDEMFEALAVAGPEEAQRIEDRIVTAWSKSGSASMDLLLQRGSDALDAGEYQAAVEHFTAAIDHSPDFAEAYHGRATAYYLLDYYGPALDDLRQALVLEPRHFGALRGFGEYCFTTLMPLSMKLGRRSSSTPGELMSSCGTMAPFSVTEV